MGSLELLVSGPGTGKTSYCIDLFREKLARSCHGLDSRVFFVLPNREHADRIAHLVLKKDIPGFFNAHILTIQDLSAKLFASSGRYASYVTDSVRMSLLSGLVTDTKHSFPYFKDVKDDAGFIEALADAFREFESSLLTVPEFEKLCQPLLSAEYFRAKYRDFTVLLKNYQAAIKTIGVEEIDRQVLKLKRSDFKRPLDLVIFDGFYDFTRSQKALVNFASKISKKTVVTLTLPSDNTRAKIFDYPWQTRRFLQKAGFKLKPSPLKSFRPQNACLKHLSNTLFLPDGFQKPPSEGIITILSGANRRIEMEMVARNIRKIYSQSAVHFSDICVILRQVGPYKSLIQQVFEDFDLPVSIHEREKLIERGWVMTAKRLLNLLVEDWKAEDLLSILRSGYFSEKLTEEDLSKLETFSVSKNIRQGRLAWEALLKDESVPQGARSGLDTLLRFEGLLSQSASPKDFVLRFLDWVRRLKVDEKVDAFESRARRAFESACRSLGESPAFGKGSFDTKVFAQKLGRVLQNALFSPKIQNRNCVQVYDVVMALPKEYKIVFISGLVDGEFPKKPFEDCLFKDDERRILNRREIIFEERSRRIAGEKYFFYMAVTRARERLFLTFPQSDADNRPFLPSFFVDEVRRCFRSVPEEIVNPDGFLPSFEDWSTPGEVSRGLLELLFGSKSLRQLPGLFKQWLKNETFSKALDYGLSSKDAVLNDRQALDLFKNLNVFSATKLETYAVCSFKYFAQRALNLNQPLEGREALETGKILHGVLDDFYKGLPDNRRKDRTFWSEPEEIFKSLQSTLKNICQRTVFFQNLPLYRRKIYLDKIENTLKLFAERESALFAARGFVPAHFELKFGAGAANESPGYLVLEDESGPIRIEGQIDRIDVTASNQALVIDYKKAARSQSLSTKIKKGLELQIPIYLLAARELLGLKVMGGELRFLENSREDGIYADWAREALGFTARKQMVSEEELQATLDGASESIRQIVRRLRQGRIDINPKTCDYCEFDGICRFEK